MADTKCPDCRGTGRCPHCNGTGKNRFGKKCVWCAKPQGGGDGSLCSRCKGKGVI